MVNKKIGKGKLGVSGKAVVLGAKKEDVGPEDPGQGGSGAKGDDVELVVDADAGLLMELSAEQRAVEKAMEVQEELDTVALENRALKEELRAAKVIVDKRAKKEELKAYRDGLEERIARARQQDDEWALRGGVRREASELRSLDRSRSRSRASRGSGVGPTGSRRGSPSRAGRRSS